MTERNETRLGKLEARIDGIEARIDEILARPRQTFYEHGLRVWREALTPDDAPESAPGRPSAGSKPK